MDSDKYNYFETEFRTWYGMYESTCWIVENLDTNSNGKNAGATKEEVKTTVLLGLSVIGMKAVSKYLPLVLESFDEN